MPYNLLTSAKVEVRPGTGLGASGHFIGVPSGIANKRFVLMRWKSAHHTPPARFGEVFLVFSNSHCSLLFASILEDAG